MRPPGYSNIKNLKHPSCFGPFHIFNALEFSF